MNFNYNFLNPEVSFNNSSTCTKTIEAYYFSFVNSISIVPGIGKNKLDFAQDLKELSISDGFLNLVIALQALMSFVLIFLIGLGLRNRFKI